MKTITEKQAIALLRKYAPNEKAFKLVLAHSKAVQKVALRIAKNIDCDKDFIKTASLLHDIGRFKYFKKNVIKHGIHGAKILRKHNLPKHANVCERHLGAGINKKDIKDQKLPLPKNKCYIPLTKEEYIITHADNLIFGTKEAPFSKVIERFQIEFGDYGVKKLMLLKKKIDKLENKKN